MVRRKARTLRFRKHVLENSLPAAPFHANLFIIINSQLDSDFAVASLGTIPILGRTFDAGSKASIRSVIITSAQFCQHNGCELSVSSLPANVKNDSMDFRVSHLPNW
jgi:hypothetical protein